ncbi:hypothetical protein [Falsiphaeobacter marinintestinus]|nr:hypothetical protein [Phaeobacter marinintestinus]
MREHFETLQNKKGQAQPVTLSVFPYEKRILSAAFGDALAFGD